MLYEMTPRRITTERTRASARLRPSSDAGRRDQRLVRSAPRLHVLDRLRHQLLHGAADLMIGLVDALGIEIFSYPCEHVVVARLLEIDDDDFLRIGLGRICGEAELLCGPQAKQLVAACPPLEPDLLVVREFALEAFLALVERAHVTIRLSFERIPRNPGRWHNEPRPSRQQRGGRNLRVAGLWRRYYVVCAPHAVGLACRYETSGAKLLLSSRAE